MTNIKFMGFSKGEKYFTTFKNKVYSERLFEQAKKRLQLKAYNKFGSWDFVEYKMLRGKQWEKLL